MPYHKRKNFILIFSILYPIFYSMEADTVQKWAQYLPHDMLLCNVALTHSSMKKWSLFLDPPESSEVL